MVTLLNRPTKKNSNSTQFIQKFQSKYSIYNDVDLYTTTVLKQQLVGQGAELSLSPSLSPCSAGHMWSRRQWKDLTPKSMAQLFGWSKGQAQT